MKRFEVTYKVLNLLFGGNIFVTVIEANSEKEAIYKVEHKSIEEFNKVLDIKEV